MALAGCACSVESSGPATTPCRPISAIQLSPSRSALSLLITTTAHPPSEICEAVAALMAPSLRNAGRRAASDSAVVSARIPSSRSTCTGSPRRCGTETGTTSSSNRPSSHARAALRCEAAAKASMSSRAIGSSSFFCSVSSPMDWSVNTSCSPSRSMWSTSAVSPNFTPARLPSSMCGARLIDSWPPATTTSNSPARMSWSASAIASSPDRHTLFTVSAGTCMGMPAFTAACRAGICPAPAVSTWPMITYSTSPGATPALSRAPAMAMPPRSAPVRSLSEPIRRPTGVRAPATMTDVVTACPLGVGGRRAPARWARARLHRPPRYRRGHD